MPVALKDMARAAPVAENLMGFLKAMEFNTLKRRLAERYDIDADAYAASKVLAAKAGAKKDAESGIRAASQGDGHGTRARPPAVMPPLDVSAYTCVTKADELQEWVARAARNGVVAVDTETDGLDAMQCRLVGISLAVAPGEACYVPGTRGR